MNLVPTVSVAAWTTVHQAPHQNTGTQRTVQEIHHPDEHVFLAFHQNDSLTDIKQRTLNLLPATQHPYFVS